MRVALFDLGVHVPRRLLLIIHHLVVDGVSWRILLEDLQTAYQQLSRKETMQLPAKTSFQHWSYRVGVCTFSTTAATVLAGPVPEARWSPASGLSGATTLLLQLNRSTSLSVEETQALLQEVPKAYNTQINDVLLTALVQALLNGRAIALSSGSGRPRTENFR